MSTKREKRMWYWEAKAKGICTNCRNSPAREGRMLCLKCQSSNRLRSQKHRDAAKTKGFCQTCCRRPARFKKSNCSKCAEADLNRKRRTRFGGSNLNANGMLDRQGFRCAICGKPDGVGNRANKRLALDHDHRSKKLRGMLCCECNRGIGLLNDSPELLQKASLYLIRNGAPLTPSPTWED